MERAKNNILLKPISHFFFLVPLGLDEVKASIGALAAFHASSRMYLNTNADPGDNLMKSGWLVHNNQFDSLVKLLFNVSADIFCESISNFQKCKAFITNWHNIASQIDRKSDPTKDVIISDDFWYHNIMFR